MSTAHYDLLIVGGGLIGASLACALRDLPLRVGIIDARPMTTDAGLLGHPDARSVALSYGSTHILKQWGIWPALQPLASPIQYIHISDRQHFGFTRLRASEERVPALGYVVENTAFQHVLNAALVHHVTQMAPVQVRAMTQCAKGWELLLEVPEGQRVCTATCVVAADGSDSLIRKLQNIPVKIEDYAQHAIVANVMLKRSHNHIAYERLTQQGPLALLPLGERRCALVWTVSRARATELHALADTEFLAQLQYHFGYRLGRFETVGRRDCYPLFHVSVAEHLPQAGCVLLGNAMHTLHPIAGQGLNLGLRDVASFVRHLRAGMDMADPDRIAAYYKERRPDQIRTQKLTDSLLYLFSHQHSLLSFPRNCGLVLTDLCSTLKHRIARRGMGLVTNEGIE